MAPQAYRDSKGLWSCGGRDQLSPARAKHSPSPYKHAGSESNDAITDFFFAELAVMPAIKDVNYEPQRQPDHEAQPGNQRQPEHQSAAEKHGEQREPRHKRHAERALAIRADFAAEESRPPKPAQGNSVPMLARSAASPMSPVQREFPPQAGDPSGTSMAFYILRCTAENNFGSRPSRDMAYQIRACPY